MVVQYKQHPNQINFIFRTTTTTTKIIINKPSPSFSTATSKIPSQPCSTVPSQCSSAIPLQYQNLVSVSSTLAFSQTSESPLFYSSPVHIREAQKASFSCPGLDKVSTAGHLAFVLSQATARVQMHVGGMGRAKTRFLDQGSCRRDAVITHTVLQQSSHSEICLIPAPATQYSPDNQPSTGPLTKSFTNDAISSPASFS